MRMIGAILFGLLACSSPSERAVPVSLAVAKPPPVTPASTPASAPISTATTLAASAPSTEKKFLEDPGPFTHEVTVAARWKASLGGLVNLAHPNAKAANLKEFSVPIVLPAHILTHPKFGMFIVDTGITKKSGYGNITVADPLLDIIARHKEPFTAALLTHSHYDHVMGIPEMPKGSTLYAGPGELKSVANKGVTLKTFDFKDAKKIGDMPAIDILGDGSLWALWVPGHTRGSIAYLANTTTGPMLFTGDTSHTIWGWENGVGPGGYSGNKVKNQESVDKLRAFAKEHPKMKVYVGHEIDGTDTGVDEAKK
jgi:N-acyl homoserine lactone hydrolase